MRLWNLTIVTVVTKQEEVNALYWTDVAPWIVRVVMLIPQVEVREINGVPITAEMK